jgi:hypothetical protein
VYPYKPIRYEQFGVGGNKKKRKAKKSFIFIQNFFNFLISNPTNHKTIHYR